MNTECFIKSFLLIVVIFLIISCWTNRETFTETKSKIEIDFISPDLAEKIKKFNPFKLELNNTYVFVSFDQLKEVHQKIVIDKLKNNSEFMVQETIQDVEKGIFYKTPVFIVDKNEVSDNNKLDFIIVRDSGFWVLSPFIQNQSLRDKYLYFNEDMGLIYYSKTGPNNDSIYIDEDGFKKKFVLNEIWNNTNLKSIKKVTDKNLKKLKISIK